MRYRIFFLVLGILTGIGEATGQEKLSKQELIKRMKEGRYHEAFESLENHYKKFPKDPDYIYYTGVCRVQLSTNIPGAIELLSEATRQTTFKETWFYLGRAYMLNYQFNNAEEAFGRFNDKATKDEKEKVQFPMHLAMCRNAQDICSRSKKVTVIKIDTINETNLLAYLNKQQIKGHLEKTDEPAKFSTRVREGVKYKGNDIILESKYSFGKKHKDIFISEDEDIEINKSKTIGNLVNSPNEEEFVFYDETIPALYFSSQGHNSSGGFDIFKSYFDKTTKKWSKPVNMGFPINTTYDEVAYLTIQGTGKSILASKRNGEPGKLVVYTFENAEESTEEPIISANAPELSMLKPGMQNLSSSSKNKHVKEKTKLAVNPRNEVPSEIRNEQNYQRMIHEALNLQIRSDSIKRISDEKKEQLITSKLETDKTRLWQEIKVLDAKADEIQQKADVLYKKARELETEKQEMIQVNAKELAQKAFSNKRNENTKSTETITSKKTLESSSPEGSETHDIQYRIQVGVFSKPPPDALFKGFSNIYKENLKDGAAFKYYIGLYKKASEAERGLIKVKDAGFKDAYIIGFYNGKIVPLSRARELELSIQNQ